VSGSGTAQLGEASTTSTDATVPCSHKDSSTSIRLDIQGLRGLAVLLVVLYHAKVEIPFISRLEGGFVGVDVFFVISGFVIGGLLLREHEANGRVNVKHFFARRARRLLPVLSVVTSVVLIAAVCLVNIEALKVTALTGAAVSVFAANMSLYWTADYFAPDVVLNPLLHMWSLSVEGQFYLVFPFIFIFSPMLAAHWGLENKKTFMGFMLAGCIVSFALSHYLLTARTSVLGFTDMKSLSFYAPYSRAWEFGVGAMVAAYNTHANRRDWAQRYSSALGLLGLALIIYAAVTFTENTLFPGCSALLPVAGAALIIMAGTRAGSSWINRALEGPCLSTIGNWSYSWYLWHWPFIVFTAFLWPEQPEALGIAACVSVVPAWLSFRFVEQKFRGRKATSAQNTAKIIIAAVCLPVLLSLSVMWLEKKAFSNLENADSFIAISRNNRQAEREASALSSRLDQPLDIVIVGDSHAGALSQGLFDLAEQYGVLCSRITTAGCYLLKGPYTGKNKKGCAQWQKDTLDLLLRAEVGTVILHGYMTGRLTGWRRGRKSRFLISSPDGSPPKGGHAALGLYEEGLYAVVDSLTAAGKTVILVTSIPDFSQWLPTSTRGKTLSAWSALSHNYPQILEDKMEKIKLADAQAHNAPLWEIESRIADQFEKAYVLDVSPFLCEDSMCQQFKDGLLLYFDRNHLAFEGAKKAAKPLLDFWAHDLKQGNQSGRAQSALPQR